MLLYQKCIVTKLFKKKKKNQNTELGLYSKCILLALCSVLKEDSYLGRQIADILVCSMYLPDVVALLCTDKCVLWGLFPGKLLLVRDRQVSSEPATPNHHVQLCSWCRASSVLIC